MRALVEAVDLELQPVEAEVDQEVALQQPRRVVADAAAAEVRVHGEPADVRDAGAAVDELEVDRAGALAVDLDHEEPERVGLAAENARSARGRRRARAAATAARNGCTSSSSSSAARNATSPAPARRIETLTTGGRLDRTSPEPHRAGAEPDAAEDQREPEQRRRGDRLVQQQRAVHDREAGIR